MQSARNVFIVIDLAFGDCGKGTVVDFLTRRHGARTVVRFNGGPQAGHNVVTPDGRHHTFSQFGSGTFVPGARTFLSRFMLIEPYALMNEAEHLAQVGVGNALERLLIDRRAPVITPAHQAANRLREIARGDGAHGTCGMGVGETMQDLLDRPELMLRAGDLEDRQRVSHKLREVVDYKVEKLRDVIAAARPYAAAKANLQTLLEPSWIDAATERYARMAERARLIDAVAARELLREEGTIICEGAQGVLLDEWFGFHPHTTWSTTTFENALTLLDECWYEGSRTKIGVLRTYFTRHGAGPFVSEDSSLRSGLPEPHNGDAGWQRGFRVGVFDAVAARYALAVAGGADWLALTHLDRVERLPRHLCDGYELDGIDERLFVRDGKRISDIRVHRPADLSRQERLTASLRRCRPVYTPLPKPGGEGFVQAIERELRTPVKLVSWGPAAEDKRLL
jgi:adenylosuccinate synthase